MKEIDNANENISGLEGLILLKLSKLISRFDVILTKITMAFFAKNKRNTCKTCITQTLINQRTLKTIEH